MNINNFGKIILQHLFTIWFHIVLKKLKACSHVHAYNVSNITVRKLETFTFLHLLLRGHSSMLRNAVGWVGVKFPKKALCNTLMAPNHGLMARFMIISLTCSLGDDLLTYLSSPVASILQVRLPVQTGDPQ